MILAFDPGEKNIGVAMFTYDSDARKADLKVLKILSKDELYHVLGYAETLLPEGGTHEFVVENFRVDQRVRGAKFQWNEMTTIRVIGAIEYAAFRMNNSKVHFQEPSILATGRKWCDLPLPRGHIPDDKSAYIHGVHFLMKSNRITSTKDVYKFGQDALT